MNRMPILVIWHMEHLLVRPSLVFVKQCFIHTRGKRWVMVLGLPRFPKIGSCRTSQTHARTCTITRHSNLRLKSGPEFHWFSLVKYSFLHGREKTTFCLGCWAPAAEFRNSRRVRARAARPPPWAGLASSRLFPKLTATLKTIELGLGRCTHSGHEAACGQAGGGTSQQQAGGRGPRFLPSPTSRPSRCDHGSSACVTATRGPESLFLFIPKANDLWGLSLYKHASP